VEHCEPFTIGSHHAVLDAIVHHLDEVAGTVPATMQITLVCSRLVVVSAGCLRCCIVSRRECPEYRLKVTYCAAFAADHQAIAAFTAPDTTAGAYIEVTDVLFLQALCTSHVDNDVVVAQQACKLLNDVVDDLIRHHDPDCSWCLQSLHQVFDGISSFCAERRHLVPGAPGARIDHATVAIRK
jgi:hypothetical protein